MAVAFDNFNSTDNAAAISQPFSTAFTIAANAYAFLGIRSSVDTNNVSSVIDNQGGAWNFVSFNDNNGTGTNLIVYKCLNCPGGSTTITVTLSTSVTMRAVVASYTGVGSDEGLVNGTVNGANMATIISGNIITSGSNEWIVGIVSTNTQTNGITPNSGETSRGSVALGRMEIQDKLKTTSGIYTMSWAFSLATNNNSDSYACIALKPSSGSVLPLMGQICL